MKKTLALMLSVIMMLTPGFSAYGAEFVAEDVFTSDADENAAVTALPEETAPEAATEAASVTEAVPETETVSEFSDDAAASDMVSDGTAADDTEVFSDDTAAVETGDAAEACFIEMPAIENVNGLSGLLDFSEPQPAFFSMDSEMEAAAETLRKGMVNRESEIQVTVSLPELSEEERGDFCKNMWKTIFQLSLQETENANEGDYLHWHLGESRGRSGYRGSEGIFIYNPTYYTTLEQEQAVTAEIDSILAGMKFTDKTTDYVKIKTIYDYICKNTKYEDEQEKIDDKTYTLKYSAYAALIDKEAVCQGYAQLLYRMLREVGISTRLIVSEEHMWNIVKLHGLYYNADCTWDSDYPGNYRWFLKSDATFETDSRHIRQTDKECSTEAFYMEYPMSDTDYEKQAMDTPVKSLQVSGPEKTEFVAGETIEVGMNIQEIAELFTGAVVEVVYEDDYATRYPLTDLLSGKECVDDHENIARIEPSDQAVKMGTNCYTIRVGEAAAIEFRFEVVPASLTAGDVTLKSTKATCTGKAVTVDVTVKHGGKTLVKGTDYTVQYSSNKEPGTAYVTVSGQGNYKGTVKKEFKIVMPAVKLGKVQAAGYSSIKITWNKVSAAQGYTIYRKKSGEGWKSIKNVSASASSYTDKKATTGTKFFYTVRAYRTVNGKKVLGDYNKSGIPAKADLAKTNLNKIIISRGKITLKWKKTSGATSYEVYYKAGKKGAWKKLKTVKGTSVVHNKTKKGTQYSYKVRACIKVGKKTVKGPYGSASQFVKAI